MLNRSLRFCSAALAGAIDLIAAGNLTNLPPRAGTLGSSLCCLCAGFAAISDAIAATHPKIHPMMELRSNPLVLICRPGRPN